MVTKRRSHSRPRSSKKRSGKRGGRTLTFVGPAWSPPANNTHAALTALPARANHFAVSNKGILVGGVHPAVPEMWGPGITDTNMLPPLKGGRNLKRKSSNNLKRSSSNNLKRRSISGLKRSSSNNLKRSRSRSKKGGYVFGGFPQVATTAWQNAVIGVKNMWHGFNGQPMLPSASAWNQPYLLQHTNTPANTQNPSSAMKQLATIEKAVTQRVANA